MARTRNLPAIMLAIAAMLLLAGYLEASTPKFHVDVGLNHFYKNRYLEAYREFKAALELDQRYPEAHYNLGRVYKAQGFIKEALIEFQIAVQLRPDYLAARRELDALKNTLADDVSAQLKLQGKETVQQTEFSTMSSDEAEKRARQLLTQGRTDEALKYFDLALRDRPNDSSLNKLAGFLYFKQNSYSDALSRYLKAQANAPNDAEIPYAIGLIYMKTSMPQKAETFFNQSIRLQNDMIKAHFALGEAYEAQERLEDAVFQFRKCLEMNPKLKEAEGKLSYLAGRQSYNYFSRGSYYYQRGEYDKAEPLLSMARTYGSLTGDQIRQSDEMINTCRFWINKNKAQEKVNTERRQTSNEANIGRSFDVYDVSRNAIPYIGRAVEWRGTIEFVSTRKGRKYLFVNSQPSVNAYANMDYSFEIEFPKDLPNDPRIAVRATVTVKGRILRVDKIKNNNSGTFSSRRQPVIEASEITITKINYDPPLNLQFY
ncbi:MAG TPA: tetratricopeptide repeat protein [Candidatus Rifleibacterium sp.]|nr:tetratricopeptide repeat protein [Candidatus Rifleibacterium sp.]HPT46771.1 tetratricopeptide repeat protein [Candidatus Rifleibacterium sp.]